MIDADQRGQRQCKQPGDSSRRFRFRPDERSHGEGDAGHKNRVRPAQPVQQRHHGEARQRASAEIGAIHSRNTVRFTRKHNGEQQSS